MKKEDNEMKNSIRFMIGVLVSVYSCSIMHPVYADDSFVKENIADDYVEVKNGQLIVSNEKELKKKIGKETVNEVEDDLEICNRLIEEGYIGVKKNGTLYLLNDSSLTIQGGNITRTNLYWWGFKRYNNNKQTQEIIKELEKQSGSGKTISNSKLVSLLGMAPVFGTMINATAKVSGILGSGFSKLSSAYKSKNKGYGTITTVYWSVVGSSITSQTTSTK